MKITIIGAGSIGGAIARGLAKGNMFKASDITCTAQSQATLDKMKAANPDFVLSLNNIEAVKGADTLNSYLTKNTSYEDWVTPALFRIMPNTAIEVLSSMTFVSAHNATPEQSDLIINIFNELGNAMLVEERLMGAGTALASSGIAFALRYIRAAIEGGVELGFYPKQAQEIVVHTVKGANDLLDRKSVV